MNAQDSTATPNFLELEKLFVALAQLESQVLKLQFENYQLQTDLHLANSFARNDSKIYS